MLQESKMPSDTEKNSNTEKTVNQEKNDMGEAERSMIKVEAALYVSGRPLTLKEICSVLKTSSKNKTRRFTRMLMEEYASRNTALEILELNDDRYVLQLKPEFTRQVKKLVKRPLLTRGPLKTLAYIAYKQPVAQKRVAEMRGSHSYGHIRQLKDMDLVVGEKKGRSPVLRTTDHFADYFGLSHYLPVMKRQLKKVFEEELEDAGKQKETEKEE